MSKRRRKSKELSMASDLCQEPIEAYKARFKKSKRQLKAIMELYREDGIEYDIQDELVGRAYLRVLNTKRELAYRKNNK